MTDPQLRRVRYSLNAGLKCLASHLAHHEQTTHGSIFLRPVEIEHVTEMIVKCWHEPTPFNISELSQRIEAMTPSQVWVSGE